MRRRGAFRGQVRGIRHLLLAGASSAAPGTKRRDPLVCTRGRPNRRPSSPALEETLRRLPRTLCQHDCRTPPNLTAALMQLAGAISKLKLLHAAGRHRYILTASPCAVNERAGQDKRTRASRTVTGVSGGMPAQGRLMPHMLRSGEAGEFARCLNRQDGDYFPRSNRYWAGFAINRANLTGR
jgi:hypothetical protein